jgi:hypothetical protein
VGGLWLAGGLAVTAFSYGSAGPGGRYVITTGAIIYGAYRIMRGLARRP